MRHGVWGKKHIFLKLRTWVIQSRFDSDLVPTETWAARWSRKGKGIIVKALRGLSVGVCVGSSAVYLGDPPVPVWGQGVTGATEAVVQQAARRGRYAQLKQHFVVAVAFGQLWHPVAVPVAGTGEAKGLAAGFGRQLVREKIVFNHSWLFYSCIVIHLKMRTYQKQA